MTEILENVSKFLHAASAADDAAADARAMTILDVFSENNRA